MWILATMLAVSCITTTKKDTNQDKDMDVSESIKQKAEEFASFKLTTDLSVLSEKEKQMLPLLFEAADLMEEIYW